MPTDHGRDRHHCAAFHEAGHIVVRAFTELGWQGLHGAAIGEDSGPAGRMCGNADHLMAYTRRSREYEHVAVRVQIMELLAGPWAHAHVAGLLRMSWRDFDASAEGRGEDIPTARDLAEIATRDRRAAETLMDTVDSWTQDMLEVPNVWPVLEACAGLLADRGSMNRAELCDVCEPILGLGRRLREWRRRIFRAPNGRIPREFGDTLIERDPIVTRP